MKEIKKGILTEQKVVNSFSDFKSVKMVKIGGDPIDLLETYLSDTEDMEEMHWLSESNKIFLKNVGLEVLEKSGFFEILFGESKSGIEEINFSSKVEVDENLVRGMAGLMLVHTLISKDEKDKEKIEKYFASADKDLYVSHKIDGKVGAIFEAIKNKVDSLDKSR